MLIRVESLADIIAIKELYHGLGGEFIQRSDEIIRIRESGKITLSLVACNDDGEVIGHSLFMPVAINGEDHNWQCLKTLVANTQAERIPVEQALIQSGLDSLAEFGYPVCVAAGDYETLSDSAFYPSKQFTMVETAAPVFICELIEDGLTFDHGMISAI